LAWPSDASAPDERAERDFVVLERLPDWEEERVARRDEGRLELVELSRALRAAVGREEARCFGGAPGPRRC
jgi:hypothetical protein